ncbi:hypothetical protein GCM10023310_70090 [Paenibacillus vulneris]|uniref:CARD domain-containing protein n=1 Tax=Paenibacillus vulneris TaxID=1133364 RepID=A0ABW3UGV6_9BACL
MSDDIKEILKKVTYEVMKDFDDRIKILAKHIAEADANYMAIVLLLEEKGIITTDEFDAKKDIILEKIKDDYAKLAIDLNKHKKENGIQ